MKGRGYSDNGPSSGLYTFVNNGTHPYWLKNSTSYNSKKSIWFDDEDVRWRVGSFKDIQSKTSTLTTYNGSSCPEFPENLWYVGDGNTFLLHPQSDVDVTPWTTGEYSICFCYNDSTCNLNFS